MDNMKSNGPGPLDGRRKDMESQSPQGTGPAHTPDAQVPLLHGPVGKIGGGLPSLEGSRPVKGVLQGGGSGHLWAPHCRANTEPEGRATSP